MSSSSTTVSIPRTCRRLARLAVCLPLAACSPTPVIIASPLLPEPVPPVLLARPSHPDLACRASSGTDHLVSAADKVDEAECYRAAAIRHRNTLGVLQQTIVERYAAMARLKAAADAERARLGGSGNRKSE